MITQVINIVRNASELMVTDVIVEQKGNESNFVTSADVNVQRFLEKQSATREPADSPPAPAPRIDVPDWQRITAYRHR